MTIRILFLLLLFILSCDKPDTSLSDEIEAFLSDNMPGYQLMPENFSNPEIGNRIPEFEGAISKRKPSGHKHIVKFDFNRDGIDDYTAYVFTENLTKTTDEYKYYESKQILIYGDQSGFSTDIVEFGGNEIGYREKYTHIIDSDFWVIESGNYTLSGANDTTLIIPNNTLIGFDETSCTILIWLDNRNYEFLRLKNE